MLHNSWSYRGLMSAGFGGEGASLNYKDRSDLGMGAVQSTALTARIRVVQMLSVSREWSCDSFEGDQH